MCNEILESHHCQLILSHGMINPSTLTLLHSESPKLYTILAYPSAIGLINMNSEDSDQLAHLCSLTIVFSSVSINILGILVSLNILVDIISMLLFEHLR